MRKHPFTLLELITSMAVFAIFMLALMRFFAVSQDALSLSADRTSQYERARIAMDMIANDLRNIYYTEGLNTVSYYQDGEELSIPVNRLSKIGDSVTTLARVTYKFEPDNFLLKVAAIGDEDGTNWHLDKKFADDATVIPSQVFPSLGTYTNWGELLDGVIAFRLIPLNSSSETVSCGVAQATRRIPDIVRIEITLIDKGSMDKIKAFTEQGLASSDAEKRALIDNAQLRVFTRDVEIDRGQYN